MTTIVKLYLFMTDRHAFRAKWHDYHDGIYFVTICSAGKEHLFGHIHNIEMWLSELGQIIKQSILDLPNHHNVQVWNYVVMPNHIHIVISVGKRPAASAQTSTTPATASVSPPNTGCLKPSNHGDVCIDFHHNSELAVIVGSLKSAVTRKYRQLMRARQDLLMRTRQAASLQIWQQRYHEHIIRNQQAFDNIMEYVSQNVEKWGNDIFNQNKLSS